MSSSAAALGYRWPAEWEPHRATWLSWPHNPDTWPGRLPAVRRTFAEIAAALAGRELVCTNVRDDAMEEEARKALAAAGVDADRDVRFHRIATNDAWARDHGPIFVVRDGPDGRARAVVDFAFDNWGRKYPGFELDDAVARRVAEACGLPCFSSPWVLEGGGIDGDGAGTVLTTESCLVNGNRGPDRTRERLEAVLSEQLGARRVVWLAGGIEGDDTDGHVDDVARFVAPGTVVAVAGGDPGDANQPVLAENLRRLRAARDARGRALEVVELPSPPPRLVDGGRVPESYANFYLANGVVLVPVYGVSADARALDVLRELLPDRELVPIPCSDLVVGLGAIHCVTQQEPA